MTEQELKDIVSDAVLQFVSEAVDWSLIKGPNEAELVGAKVAQQVNTALFQLDRIYTSAGPTGAPGVSKLHFTTKPLG